MAYRPSGRYFEAETPGGSPVPRLGGDDTGVGGEKMTIFPDFACVPNRSRISYGVVACRPELAMARETIGAAGRECVPMTERPKDPEFCFGANHSSGSLREPAQNHTKVWSEYETLENSSARGGKKLQTFVRVSLMPAIGYPSSRRLAGWVCAHTVKRCKDAKLQSWVFRLESRVCESEPQAPSPGPRLGTPHGEMTSGDGT